MAFRKITEGDMLGKGNVGRPDTPGVSTAEMQRIMDELPREVLAPAFNELAGQLEAETAAADIGAAAPEGVTAAPAGKLQAVLDGMMAGLSAAIQGATGTAVWNDTPDTTLAQARAHEENAQRHVTATERENWNGAAGLMDAIDCGSFTGAPLDALSMHSVNAKAHRMLELDGNTEQAGAQPDTLEEHMTDRSAHGNMIVDGNMG